MKAMLERPYPGVLVLLLVLGCGGVGPRPEHMAADLPAAVELDAEAHNRVDADVERALTMLAVDDFAAARAAAEAALRVDPRAARARAVLARCWMQEARAETPPTLALWQRAEGEFRRAARLAPGDASVGRLQAEFLEADGHLSAAAAALERVLAADAEDADTLQVAARLHYDLGEHRAALSLLERLARLRVLDPDSLYRLAHCKLELANAVPGEPADACALRFEDAALAFRAYREGKPDDADGYLGEAHARFSALQARGLRDAGAQPELLALFEQAEQRTTSAAPTFGRAVVLEWFGDAQAARQIYTEALARDAQHVPTLLNLAANLATEGREEEARAHCQRALELGVTPAERRRIERFIAK